MAYNILINDGIEKEGLFLFSSEPSFSITNEHRNGKGLLETIGDFDALLVRSKTTVTREIIEAGGKGKLRLIGRGGVGTDNIDESAANEYGIIVKSAPNGITNSTAEHAIGLMFAVARKISNSDHALKNGIWRKKEFTGIELEGKTLGIVGCGRIGQRVGTIARGIGLKVVGYDYSMQLVRMNFPDSLIEYCDNLENLLNYSDIVTLHTGGKRTIIGENELNRMKHGAILINASRGGNIDERALYHALNSRRLYGAGLDTYEKEPKDDGQKITDSMKLLSQLDNIVMTSHLGASTDSGQERTSVELAKVTIEYFTKADYSNSINTIKPSDEGKILYTLCILHKDVPDMFGQMTHILGRNGINIRDIRSEQIKGDGMVVTNYTIHQPVDESTLSDIRSIDGVRRALFTNPYPLNFDT